ncbi:MAG TPA: zf-HC2 domain-containing protein, partial [Vicinamibacteria bacterium]
MTCEPEHVTAFVDGELDGPARTAMAAHLEECATCRAQAEEERALRARLRELPLPELPAELEARVRRGVRRHVPVLVRWALPAAAALVAAAWLRGYGPLVAWDLARDHDKCFRHHPVPAKVWSAEPPVVAGWFEEQSTFLPQVPDRVGDVALVGARYCPLVGGAFAPHVYYQSRERQVSVFVVPYPVRFSADGFAARPRGRAVRLLRFQDEIVGIVAAGDAEAREFEAALRPVLASWLAAVRRPVL